MAVAVEIDQTFGLNTVIRFAGKNKWHVRLWECRCACGTVHIIQESGLRKYLSCGCLQSSQTKKRFTTHGQSYTPEYAVWLQMKQRCNNPNFRQYGDYGGRGIRVCEEWVHSFESFLAYMGPRPSRQHTIDRSDNDKGYQPGNCQWVLRSVQNRNSRRNRLITLDGLTLCITDWALRCGIAHETIRARLRVGWPEDAAVNTPAGKFKPIPHRPVYPTGTAKQS